MDDLTKCDPVALRDAHDRMVEKQREFQKAYREFSIINPTVKDAVPKTKFSMSKKAKFWLATFGWWLVFSLLFAFLMGFLGGLCEIGSTMHSVVRVASTLGGGVIGSVVVLWRIKRSDDWLS